VFIYLSNDTCLYATERKEGYVLRKLQRGLNSMFEWSKSYNIKINGHKTQGLYFPFPIRPPESLLTTNGRNIPFVNNLKYIRVIFDKNILWRLHIKAIEAKAFRAFIKTHSLFKSERLSANFKLTLHKALNRSIMTYVCPAWNLRQMSPKKNKLRGLSPRANYTDRATAACRRS
jgi:hypothetical protein